VARSEGVQANLYYYDNPGTAAADKSIGEAKGWNIHDSQ
jgi:hypothetical protein